MEIKKTYEIEVNKRKLLFQKETRINDNTEIYFSIDYKIFIHPKRKICLLNIYIFDLYIDLNHLLKLKATTLDEIMEEICNNHKIEIYFDDIDKYKVYDYNMNILNFKSKRRKNTELSFRYINIYLNKVLFELDRINRKNLVTLEGYNKELDIFIRIESETDKSILNIIRKDLIYKGTLDFKIDQLHNKEINLEDFDFKDFMEKSDNKKIKYQKDNNFININVNKKMLEDNIDRIILRLDVKPNIDNKRRRSKYTYYKGIPILNSKNMNIEDIINSINKIIKNEFIYKSISEINKQNYYDACRNKIFKFLNVNKYKLTKQAEFYANIDKLIDDNFICYINKLL